MSLGDWFTFKDAEKQVKEEKRLTSKERYQTNLAKYNETLVARDEDNFQYRREIQPYQLVVESDPDDFSEGLKEGIERAKNKMAMGISNYMKAQFTANGNWPIENFSGVGDTLCYGVTLYLLTDEDMKELERRLRGNKG